jgi:hypothetical protein
MQTARNVLSTDGFLLNVLAVVFRLLKRQSSDATLSLEFCALPCRLELDDETRLALSHDEILRYQRQGVALDAPTPASPTHSASLLAVPYTPVRSSQVPVSPFMQGSSPVITVSPSIQPLQENAVSPLPPPSRPVCLDPLQLLGSNVLPSYATDVPSASTYSPGCPFFPDRSSEADRAFFIHSQSTTHEGVICDKKREKSFEVSDSLNLDV